MDFADKEEADSAGLIRFAIMAGNAYFEAMSGCLDRVASCSTVVASSTLSRTSHISPPAPESRHRSTAQARQSPSIVWL
jgi:hypothetical protein